MGSAIKIFMEEGGDLRVLEAIKNIWGRIWHLQEHSHCEVSDMFVL